MSNSMRFALVCVALVLVAPTIGFLVRAFSREAPEETTSVEDRAAADRARFAEEKKVCDELGGEIFVEYTEVCVLPVLKGSTAEHVQSLRVKCEASGGVVISQPHKSDVLCELRNVMK